MRIRKIELDDLDRVYELLNELYENNKFIKHSYKFKQYL